MALADTSPATPLAQSLFHCCNFRQWFACSVPSKPSHSEITPVMLSEGWASRMRSPAAVEASLARPHHSRLFKVFLPPARVLSHVSRRQASSTIMLPEFSPPTPDFADQRIAAADPDAEIRQPAGRARQNVMIGISCVRKFFPGRPLLISVVRVQGKRIHLC